MTYSRPLSALLSIAFVIGAIDLASGQQAISSSEATTAAADEFAARGQREARSIKYDDWKKICFKPGGTKMICRTTISGAFETGQIAVRVYLIERDSNAVARLQLFLPVGLYMPSGVKLSVDKEVAHRIPFSWCLTNTCIAGEAVKPTLLRAMETGKNLTVEVVDTNMLAITTSVPLGQFAAIRKGAPLQVFEQKIDE